MKRIAIVGLGQRGAKYLAALGTAHRHDCELAAICDASLAMLEVKRPGLAAMGLEPKLYAASDFEKMIREIKPETVVVLSPDHTHGQYVCQAMEFGCDVIVEKPLTTSYDSCREILETQNRTGRRCAVTLNYRYNPAHRHIKHLLQSGVIGNVIQVAWASGTGLDHGARFFRRWHAEKANSGSLLVHKCCHLFDLANFWLGAVPRKVFATGSLNLFGPAAAARMGLEKHGPRCGECDVTERCPYYLDIQSQVTHNESPEEVAARGAETGYFRDKCVFRDEIDVHDTLSVMVQYETGAQLDFSWSAVRLGNGLLFRGTLGALEYGWSEPGKIVIHHYGGATEVVKPWRGEGGHGGADPALFNDLFGSNPGEDAYGCRADLRDGVWSVLVGLGAMESIETQAPVVLGDRVKVGRPDYRPMPMASDPLPPEPLRMALVKDDAEPGEE